MDTRADRIVVAFSNAITMHILAKATPANMLEAAREMRRRSELNASKGHTSWAVLDGAIAVFLEAQAREETPQG